LVYFSLPNFVRQEILFLCVVVQKKQAFSDPPPRGRIPSLPPGKPLAVDF
jgi:hypothetical protein